jgi:hypothetical protein
VKKLNSSFGSPANSHISDVLKTLEVRVQDSCLSEVSSGTSASSGSVIQISQGRVDTDLLRVIPTRTVSTNAAEELASPGRFDECDDHVVLLELYDYTSESALIARSQASASITRLSSRAWKSCIVVCRT